MVSRDRPATIPQAAILVGGLGTRLGALTASTPKPFLPVGDRPFLAWLLRELSRFGVEEAVLLTGHLGEVAEAALPAIAARLPRPMRLTCVREEQPLGTGGALVHARAHLAPRFLLCNGDSWLDGNLARLLADAAGDPPGSARLWLRRLEDASRSGVAELAGGRVTAFHERPAGPGPGLINAGVAVLDAALLDRLPAGPLSLERDLLPVWAAAGVLHGTVGEGWFVDIGVPADLARARQALPGRLRRPALILDRDGVLNLDHGWVGSRERFEFTPGALAAVAAATAAGFHVFVATNQSGIARGLYDEAGFRALMGWVADRVRAAGGTLDDVRYCPHHPSITGPCACRKPGPGMLLDLIARWELDPARTVFVGDSESDMQAAAAAGVRGERFTGGPLDLFVRERILRDADPGRP